jgi:hypothetical protein
MTGHFLQCQVEESIDAKAREEDDSLSEGHRKSYREIISSCLVDAVQAALSTGLAKSARKLVVAKKIEGGMSYVAQKRATEGFITSAAKEVATLPKQKAPESAAEALKAGSRLAENVLRGTVTSTVGGAAGAKVKNLSILAEREVAKKICKDAATKLGSATVTQAHKIVRDGKKRDVIDVATDMLGETIAATTTAVGSVNGHKLSKEVAEAIAEEVKILLAAGTDEADIAENIEHIVKKVALNLASPQEKVNACGKKAVNETFSTIKNKAMNLADEGLFPAETKELNSSTAGAAPTEEQVARASDEAAQAIVLSDGTQCTVVVAISEVPESCLPGEAETQGSTAIAAPPMPKNAVGEASNAVPKIEVTDKAERASAAVTEAPEAHLLVETKEPEPSVMAPAPTCCESPEVAQTIEGNDEAECEEAVTITELP